MQENKQKYVKLSVNLNIGDKAGSEPLKIETNVKSEKIDDSDNGQEIQKEKFIDS